VRQDTSRVPFGRGAQRWRPWQSKRPPHCRPARPLRGRGMRAAGLPGRL